MGFMHACDSEEYRITSTKLTSGNLIIMATAKSQKPKKAVIKKSTRKTTAKKTTAKKSIATRAPQRKKKPQKTAEPRFIFTLNAEGRLTIDRLKKWTKFVGIMNIISGILYCLTIFILSIPTVVMGIVTIFMGTKLTIAANHLEYALNNSDNKSFQIAIDQLQRYFFINGGLLIASLVFIVFLLTILSLFASVFIEFWNNQSFNYSIGINR
tara:strand:- start:438 stop:1070 length:633 start_codon:yes stop_codon:yes gene_type:complete